MKPLPLIATVLCVSSLLGCGNKEAAVIQELQAQATRSETRSMQLTADLSRVSKDLDATKDALTDARHKAEEKERYTWLAAIGAFALFFIGIAMGSGARLRSKISSGSEPTNDA